MRKVKLIMIERYSIVGEMLDVLYKRREMVGRLVKDPRTGIKYEVTHSTTRDARCAEMEGGSVTRFDPKYFDSFKVLSIEMYAESQ